MANSVADGSETLVVQASNMITQNPDFAATTGWTQNSWSITGGAATSSAQSTALQQTPSPSLVQGDWYLVTWSITSYTSGSVTAQVGGTAGRARSAVGRYIDIIKAGSGSVVEWVASSFTGNIDNVTCVQIGQSVYNTTVAGTYQAKFNLKNMYDGDEVMMLVGSKLRSTGDFCWEQYATSSGDQAELWGIVSSPVVSPHEFEVAIVQLAGTAISVDWEVVSL